MALEQRIKELERTKCCGKPRFYDEFTDFPTTGDTNTLYVDRSTSSIYTWNGSEYVIANKFVNIRSAAKADGTDETTTIQTFINTHRNIYIPAGEYKVTSLNIPTNTQIITDGFDTKIIQLNTAGVDVRLINIVGSNVSIGDIYVEGDINNQDGEQHHGVFIMASSTTGPLTNIKLGNIYGKNLRGDILYVGAVLGYKLTSVTCGNILGENILRNGVSVTGGELNCGDVFVNSVGFLTVDVEGEPTNEPTYNVYFGNVKGKAVGCIATSASSPNININFKSLDLDPDHIQNISASYPPGNTIVDGLITRNTKSLTIDYFKSKNHERCEIFEMFNSGELGCEMLNIKYCELIGLVTSNTDATYPALVNGALGAIIIDNLSVITFKDIRVFNVVNNISIKNFNASLFLNSDLFRSCTNVNVGNGNITGNGRVFVANQGFGKLVNTNIICSVLASFCQPIIFENTSCTASSFLFNTDNKKHFLINCNLNSVQYDIVVNS